MTTPTAAQYRLFARRCRREALRCTARFRKARPIPGGNEFRPSHWGYGDWRSMARYWMRQARRAA